MSTHPWSEESEYATGLYHGLIGAVAAYQRDHGPADSAILLGTLLEMIGDVVRAAPRQDRALIWATCTDRMVAEMAKDLGGRA